MPGNRSTKIIRDYEGLVGVGGAQAGLPGHARDEDLRGLDGAEEAGGGHRVHGPLHARLARPIHALRNVGVASLVWERVLGEGAFF